MPSKYKKRPDGRYLLNIPIGRDENGKQKYKSIYGRTQAELEENKNEFMSQLNSGTIITDNNITMSEWAREWLKTYKSGKAHNTYHSYEIVLNANIIPTLGHFRLKEIKPHNIQSLINKYTDKPRTALKIKNALDQILNKAVHNNLLIRNIMESVEVPKYNPVKRALTDIEKNLVYMADLTTKERAFLK